MKADYYLGYVIQPHPTGLWVYDRQDRRKPIGKLCGSFGEAYAYIARQVGLIKW